MGPGLMGLGQAIDTGDQAPVQVGQAALTDPIMSSASVIASHVMLKMASVPQAQRLATMVTALNRAQAGLGDQTKAAYLASLPKYAANQKDQAMFDAIRIAVANALVPRLLALKAQASPGTSGMGQTVSEILGQTSQSVNDANAVMCSTVLPVAGVVGGFLQSTGTVNSSGAIGGSVGQGASIAGCNAGQLLIQAQTATAQAQIAQNGAVQTLALQQQQSAQVMQYTLIGAGLIGVLGVIYVIVKKA